MSDASPVLLQAVAYLESQEQNIIFRWVQVASRLPAHFRQPDEDLKTLIDHMPPHPWRPASLDAGTR